MTVRVYLSSDVGAPVLNGQVGSGINVLKSCLVTGYGSRPAAGWSEVFSGTNVSVLRPGLGNRHYFRVEDTFGDAIALKGYHTMTDANTGSNPFPSGTSVYYTKKSITADATAREWIVVADEKTVWFVTQYDTSTSWGKGQMLSFGEFNKLNPTWPALNSYIIGGLTSNIAITDSPFSVVTSPGSAIGSHATSGTINGYLNTSALQARRKVGLNYSRIEGLYSSLMSTHSSTATPSISTGGLLTSPMGVFSTATDVSTSGENHTLLGTLRGIREFLHQRPLNHMDTINGAGDLAGKQFIAINGGSTAVAQVLFEISDTWD